MSEIDWKVGDTGLTRDGRSYLVVRIDSDPNYPIDARIEGESFERCFTTAGSLLKDGAYGEDLMPPTRGVTMLTPEQLRATSEHAPAPTRDERRERIACAVLAGLAADRHRSDVQGSAENAACIAVEWADALIAELAK